MDYFTRVMIGLAVLNLAAALPVLVYITSSSCTEPARRKWPMAIAMLVPPVAFLLCMLQLILNLIGKK